MLNPPSDERDFLLALPKVQLHCHLEGTVHPSTFLALAKRHQVDLAHRPHTGPGDVFVSSTFIEFLLLFRDVCKTLREPDDFAEVAALYVDDARAAGVMHAEVFISPSTWRWLRPGVDARAVVAAMRGAIDDKTRGSDLSVDFICDVTRNFGADAAMETAKLAASLTDHGVIGIGLGGDEVHFPPALFRDVFAYARSEGLHAVAHAGEAAGAQSVRDAVELLQAERIGHGVRAAEDPAVVEMLVERRIPLEMCPTSNRLTGAVAPGAEHPLGAFLDAGACVVLDADDPTLFGTSLMAEYEGVLAAFGRARVVALAENAIDASFVDAAAKARMHERLASAARG